MPGPVGAFILHGALFLLLFHFDAMREVLGQRSADAREWVWLPEVTMIAEPPPDPSAPESEEGTPSPPESERSKPECPPVEPAPESVPVVVPLAEEIDLPEPPPVPEPPMRIAPIVTNDVAEVWTEVRAGIVKSLRYPAKARQNGTAGIVVLALRLDETGRILSAEVIPPAPTPPLCDAVRAAVRRAGPFPAVGEAIRQGRTSDRAEIAIRFQLEKSGF